MKVPFAILEQQILDAQQRLDRLRVAPAAAEDLLPQALENLSTALEELHASAEELRSQNEELVQVYDAVQRERRRYLELFEFAPEAYLVTDQSGTILEGNNAAAALLRRQQHFLVGKPLSIFIAPEDHARFYEAISGLQRGSANRLEEPDLRLLLHDGTPLEVSTSAVASHDLSGQIAGIRWLLRDITERKHFERASAERTRQTAFGAAVGRVLNEGGSLQAVLQRCAEAMVQYLGAALARIWIIDDDRQILELQASAGLYTHLDGAHSRIRLNDLKIGRIAATRQPVLTNHLAGDPYITDQDWVKREKLVAFAGYPLTVEDTILGVIAMFSCRPLIADTLDALGTAAREISLSIEHKRSEERLGDALQQIERIMESVPDVVYTLDATTRLVRWNRRLETATGLSPQELKGRPAVSFFPASTHAVVEAAIRQASTTGFSEVEVDLLRKDGGTTPYHWTAAPITDPQGRVIGITGTGHDISHRRRNEQALTQLSSQLLRLQDEERRRIGRELHDSTAQNLAGVAMNLAFLEHSCEQLAPDQRRALTESAVLIGQSLNEIRTIAYLLHPPLLDEVGLASALRWYAEGFAQRSGIHVDLTITPELGRLPSQTEIALFRIVQECLTNVHRHSGSPTVGIQISRDPSTITLEVTDEGRGLAAATAIARAKGAPLLGVGILGMRERMKQLGGRLDLLHRQPGTTIRATLPLERTDT